MCIFGKNNTHSGARAIVRTNIEIDDELMATALRVTGLATKRAAVEEGLRLLIRLKQQEEILGLAGRVQWSGDLGESRRGRNAR
jgi:Arc/MetJ family transcription regulator